MIRVMIVEDQKLVRSLLESYIQNEDGYQLAVSIPGAAEAPILCDTEDIDLVLMDVQTEHRENGLAAAKKIREAHPDNQDRGGDLAYRYAGFSPRQGRGRGQPVV